MNTFNRRKLALSTALAATVAVNASIPTALASVAPRPKHYVSWTEAQRHIHRLGVSISDTRSEVGLVGFISKACADHFEFRIEENRDFSFLVSENVDECLKAAGDQSPSDRELLNADKFVRLSSHAPKIRVADRDVSVGYRYKDELADNHKFIRQEIGQDLVFHSQKTLMAREAEERKTRLMKQADCAECRENAQAADEALIAIRRLVDLGELSVADAEAKRKEIYALEMAKIELDMKTAKGADLEALDARIVKWGRRNADSPESRNRAAALRLELARQLVISNPLSVSGNERALAILESISESGDVSDAVRGRARNGAFDQRGNLVNSQLAAMIQRELVPGADPYAIQRKLLGSEEYTSYMEQANATLKKACGGFRPSMEACWGARQSYQSQQMRIQNTVQRQIAEAAEKAAATRLQQAQQQPGQPTMVSGYDPNNPFPSMR